MICHGCGASYDSSFSFCPHCGRAKPDPMTVRVQVEGDRYETCDVREEIVSTPIMGKTKHRLVAHAVGPKGQYVVAQTPSFAARDHFDWSKKGTPACEATQALIRGLCEHGWDCLNATYYTVEHLEFRRRMKGE